MKALEWQVRSVTTHGDDIITGSRDKTIKVWREEGTTITECSTLVRPNRRFCMNDALTQ